MIERALETLSFRWDEGKGIAREQRHPLDGRSRIHCLMRIAFHANQAPISEHTVMRYAREQLDKLRWDELDERQVMMETARFYGLVTISPESSEDLRSRVLLEDRVKAYSSRLRRHRVCVR